MTKHSNGSVLSPRDRADILIAEFQALYGLAEFRMAALDRRVPASGAALLAFTSSLPLLPTIGQLLLLVAIPASVIWLLRAAINHARSFEDALRRIERIERALNTLAGEDLVGFQSSHPSRMRTVGGRTGAETVCAVALAGTVMTAACAAMAWDTLPITDVFASYAAALVSVVAYGAFLIWRWSGYAYSEQLEEPPTENDAA